jgi:hypothetical protein
MSELQIDPVAEQIPVENFVNATLNYIGASSEKPVIYTYDRPQESRG